MRTKNPSRQRVLSVKVTDGVRRVVELLTASMTVSRGKRITLTDVLEEAIREKAEREGVKVK